MKKGPKFRINLRYISSKVVFKTLIQKKKLKDVLIKEIKELKKEIDRAFIKEVTCGVMRNLPLIDGAIEKFSDREVSYIEPFVLSVLRVGVYEILFLTKVPDYATVNECVEAIKMVNKNASSFVNALLRGVAEKKEEIREEVYSFPYPEILVYKYGIPLWLVKRYLNFFGEEIEDVLSSLNKPSRTSIVFFKQEDFLKALPIFQKEKIFIEKNPYFDGTYYVKSGNIVESKALKEGLLYICDPASQIPALALPLKKNFVVLDLCSAPGTKTLVISKRLEGESFLISVDVSKSRIRELKENLEKYSVINTKPILNDFVKFDAFKKKFDAVLLDAPCSSLGTLKKNPDIRWLSSLDLIKKNAKRELEMLKKASDFVRKGGFLLYSVCSIEKEETLDVVENFLKEKTEFRKEKIRLDDKIEKIITYVDDSQIFIKPHAHEGDSFFIALFKRM